MNIYRTGRRVHLNIKIQMKPKVFAHIIIFFALIPFQVFASHLLIRWTKAKLTI